MSDTAYAHYLRDEWQLFVQHPDRAELAGAIATHIRDIQRVLDIGCGAGQELLPYLGRAVCVGLDLNAESPPIARERLRSVDAGARVILGCARAEALPLRDGQFDLVIARLVLPYTHIASALAEVARVLRTGGGFSVQIHSPRYYLRKLWRAATTGDATWRRHALRVLRVGLVLHLAGEQREVEETHESFLTRSRLQHMAAQVHLEFVTQFENANPYAPHLLFRRV